MLLSRMLLKPWLEQDLLIVILRSVICVLCSSCLPNVALHWYWGAIIFYREGASVSDRGLPFYLVPKKF